MVPMPPLIDLTGKRFGRLTVLQKLSTSSCRILRWLCRCDCGNERAVFGNSLRTGATVSCGCLQRENATTHGRTRTPEFTVWQMMLQRCQNPNATSYKDYGGRGIVVCDRWQSFEHFYADLGDRPSPQHKLERKNNDGPYSPDNCAWATPIEQGANKRNNRILELDGERRTVGEWARHLKIPKNTLLNRLQRWTLRRALTPR